MKAIRVAVEKGYTITEGGHILSPTSVPVRAFSVGGYLTFNVRDGKRMRRVQVHRMQAARKYGNRVRTGKIAFRDGDKTNCAADNIILKDWSGKAGPVTRRKIREQYGHGATISSLAGEFELNRGTVWRILHNDRCSDMLQQMV